MAAILSTERGEAHQKRMTVCAAEANRKDSRFVALRRKCNTVKDRCVREKNPHYKYYGGRGIEFRFASPLAMAEWVRDNLGYPKQGESIDRIKNEEHYEPGNLRWATTKQQANNKRRYAVDDYGARVRRLREARSDYTEQTIRTLVKQGLTDEQIIARRKWDGCGCYIRHT